MTKIKIASYVCALFLSIFSGPFDAAEAQADELKVVVKILTVKFDSFTSVESKLIFSFNQPMVEPDELKKNIPLKKLPFNISEKLNWQAAWQDQATLIISAVIKKDEFEKKYDAQPLYLNWRQELNSLTGQKLSKIAFEYIDYETVATLYPDEVNGVLLLNSFQKIPEENFQSISWPQQTKQEFYLTPFEAKISYQEDHDKELMKITFNFNQNMVDDSQVLKVLKPTDYLADLNPKIKNSIALWTCPKSYVLSWPLNNDQAWQAVMFDEFTLMLNNLKSLKGQKIQRFIFPGPQTIAAEQAANFKFSFHHLKLTDFQAKEINKNGDLIFDLSFDQNFPARLLSERLKIKDALSGQELTWNFQRINDSITISDISNHSLTIPLVIKSKIGQSITAQIEQKDANGNSKKSQPITAIFENKLAANDAYSYFDDDYPWTQHVNLYFEGRLLDGPDIDYKKFMRFDPPLEDSVELTISHQSLHKSLLSIRSKSENETIKKVTLLKGLPGASGFLNEDKIFNIPTPESYYQKLLFTGEGRYLSPKNPLLVKIAGRLVDDVTLQAWQLYEENLPTIINVEDYSSSVRSRLTTQLSKNIANKNLKLGAQDGSLKEGLIDLKKLLPGTAKGIYLLRLSSSENETEASDYYYYSDYYSDTQRYLPVVISDLGISAHLRPGQISVLVNSLSTAKPLQKAHVRVYDAANQIMAAGQTDESGIFNSTLAPGHPIFVSVKTADDLSYLAFGYNYPQYKDKNDSIENLYSYNREGWYGNGGILETDWQARESELAAPLGKNYEAFAFSPRGFYKPGEKVEVKAFVRGANLTVPEKNFPVLWQLTDPAGRTLRSGQSPMSKEGGLNFQAELPQYGRTGTYNAKFYLPGAADNPLGETSFEVMDFKPPRLKISGSFDEKYYTGPKPTIKFKLQSQYLFGAPAAELNYELTHKISEKIFAPQGYDDFIFYNYEDEKLPVPDFDKIMTGTLNEKGEAEFIFNYDLLPSALPSYLDINATVNLEDDNGSWVAKKFSQNYFPYQNVLGYKLPPDGLSASGKLKIEVVSLNPEGQAADTKELKVELFAIETYYYSTYENNRYRQRETENLEPVKDVMVSLEQGRGEVEFSALSSGSYFVRLTDPKSGAQTSGRHYLYTDYYTSTSLPPLDSVDIKLDRPFYLPGEEITATINAPFDGNLWLSVENENLVFSTNVEIKNKSAQVKIKTNEDFGPRALILATVIKALAKDDETESIRAIGQTELKRDVSYNRLRFEINAPDKMEPKTKVPLTIKMLDDKGKPLTGELSLALVDEGILALSSYEAANPLDFFLSAKRIEIYLYDLYHQLRKIEKEVLPFLTAGGGDGFWQAGLFTPFQRHQEVLALFEESILTDENGLAEINLELPEFSGQGRLMLWGAAQNKVGAFSKTIEIKRPLVLEASPPAVVAPGDSFTLPATLFLEEKMVQEDITLSLTTSGPLSLVGDNSQKITLKNGEKKTVYFNLTAKGAEQQELESGLAKISFTAESGGGKKFNRTFELSVRSPNPPLISSQSGYLTKEKTTLILSDQEFLKGHNFMELSLAPSPALELKELMYFLENYPYGCLEQTTSKAWGFLAAIDLENIAPLKDKKYLEKGLLAAAQRLATMQLNSGAFASWPTSNSSNEAYVWGSIYAGHFLTLADKKIKLPEGLKDNTLTWLGQYLDKNMHFEDDASYYLDCKAYALYVLTLNGQYEAAWANSLTEQKSLMSESGRIFLAGAKALNEGKPLPLKSFSLMPEKMQAADGTWHHSSLESAERNLALKLLMWADVDPLSHEAKQLADQLLEALQKKRLTNTQENGMALLALGSYLSKIKAGENYTAQLNAPDGQIIATAQHDRALSLDGATLRKYLNQPLSLEISGPGRPYFKWMMAGVSAQKAAYLAQDLKLEKSWLLPDGKLIDLAQLQANDEPIKVKKGDKIIVKLKISAAKPLADLVLVDLNPGGFEIENPRLVMGHNEQEVNSGNDRLELRDDRLILIKEELGQDNFYYTYSLRATTTGQFILPGTTAEGMYATEQKAILPQGTVIVEP